MILNNNDNKNNLDNPIFKIIGAIADQLNVKAYVIGGYVRDYFLGRELTDIDVTVVGDGIMLAQKVGEKVKAKVTIYKTFGTAALKYTHNDVPCEIEFVAARKESYDHSSRKPAVTSGTLEDDQNRRDFTINAMAFALNRHNYGELIDPFDGVGDLKREIIRTPMDPDKTFSDDPLRMMRAVRFATQLGFKIYPQTILSIQENAERLEIISMERISNELDKIMTSKNPARGFGLLEATGLLAEFFPEMIALKGVDRVGKHAHKDNFIHTLQVLENIVPNTDNVWLRWAALLHDVGKPKSKRYNEKHGFTFHGHETMGAKMVEHIFRRLKLPLDERMKMVQKLVMLHLRPIALVEDVVTDSAVRRLLFDAAEDTDNLMILCDADITSGDGKKVQRYLKNFEIVRQKLVEIEQKDQIRKFQPPIDGEIIMKIYNLEPCSLVGQIKTIIKDAILDGEIENDYDQAFNLMEKLAKQFGLTKK